MLNRQVEVFIAVAEAGSFTQAAKRLYLTPTAVMKHINQLERHVGTTLVERDHQGIHLTPPGTVYYRHATKLAALSRQALDEVRQAASEASVTIRVGSSFLNPIAAFFPLWEKVKAAHPEFKMQVIPFEDNRATILNTVRTLGENFDFIVGNGDSREWLEHCDFHPLGSSSFACAVPASHRLAQYDLITPTDLEGESLTMVKEGNSPSNDHLRTYLSEHHPKVQIQDTEYYYDLDTFNQCEEEGSVLLTLSG